MINAVITTSDSVKLGKELAVGEVLSDTYATMTAMADIYESVSGKIKVSGCPGKVNDKFAGKFTNVKLKNVMSGKELTVNGTYTVTVYSASDAALICEEVTTGVSETGGKTGGETGNTTQCGYESDKCEGGICCLYEECVGSCALSNGCLDKCSDASQMMECMSCMQGCASECEPKMTSECKTAYEKLESCMETNQCGSFLGDDTTLSCAKSSCCEEMNAAYAD